MSGATEKRTETDPASGPWPPGVIEVIGTGEKTGCTTISTLLAVALAQQGSHVALLMSMFGDPHHQLLPAASLADLWPRMTGVDVAPGQVRVALQCHWTAEGPRGVLARGIRKASAAQGGPEVSPDVVEFLDRPLAPGRLAYLPPEDRRNHHQVQAREQERRRMLTDREAGEIVVIDSGTGPRVTKVPVTYTLLVHCPSRRVWEVCETGQLVKPCCARPPERSCDVMCMDHQDVLVPQIVMTPRSVRDFARLLADEIGEPPLGPWALISPKHSYPTEPGFFDAVRDALHSLPGMDGLADMTYVRGHRDLIHWQSPPVRPHIPSGTTHALRTGGMVTNGIDDLLRTVITALVKYDPRAR